MGDDKEERRVKKDMQMCLKICVMLEEVDCLRR